jgi:hypothetical protein
MLEDRLLVGLLFHWCGIGIPIVAGVLTFLYGIIRVKSDKSKIGNEIRNEITTQ